MTGDSAYTGARGDIVISGLGLLTPIGDSTEAFWAAIEAGRHGIRPLDRAITPKLAEQFAATLPPPWGARIKALLEADDGIDPCGQVALHAAREAWASAELDQRRTRPERIALILGTASGGIGSRSRYEATAPEEKALRHLLLEQSRCHHAAAMVAAALGIEGPRLTVSTACTSSTQALGHGHDLLVAGHVDVVLAGGVDVLVEELAAGFYAMGAMSPGPCAPFSEPFGMTLGEGAGFAVLERRSGAQQRGVVPLGGLLGWGASADGYHSTAPEPTGAGMGRAISSAIAHAGLAKEAIGYFDAHGTGTEANDAAEWRAIKRVFGAHAEQLPVSATKSYFGHTLGAAGIIELAAALLSMQRGRLPTTLHFTRKRAFAPKKLVVGHPSRQSDHCYAVAHNAAFGGANATLVIGREPGRPPPRQCSAPAVEPVVAIGWGVLGAPESPGSQHHLQAGAPLWTALWRCGERADPDQADPLPDAHIAAGTVRSALRGLDVRGFDRNSKLLTAAANLALLDASVRVRGPLRDRIGIMVGANRLPWDSADDFWGATRSRGLDRASAPAFSRIVMNAAAGACSRALSLRGPLSVFAEGVGGCLRATLLGAEMLSRRDDLDLLLVGSAYELGHGMCEDLAYQRLHGPLPPAGEAAAVVLLAKRSFARAHDLTARAILRASALSGPADPASSLRQCLAAGACAPSAVDAVFIAASDAQSEAAARAALALTFGEKPKNLLEYLPATAVGTGESMDAVGLAAACQAVSSPPVAPPAGPRRPSGPTRCALVFAVNELTGATAALVQAAV